MPLVFGRNYPVQPRWGGMARYFRPLTAAAPIAALIDDFDDNAWDPVRWPSNYGDFAETGGRFRIDCDVAQWSGLESAAAYTLQESQVSLRAYPPAANTATVAYLSVLVTTTTPGTDAGFNIDTATSGISYISRVGFSDGSAVLGTYDPVNHAWLRLRVAAATMYWETSPDGTTWTERRSAAAPSWVGNSNLALLCESHRDAGTDNFAEIDNVNVTPAAGQSAAAGQVVETDTAQALAEAKAKVAGQIVETDTARPLVARKSRGIGQVVDTGTAQPAARVSTTAVGQVTETSTAQPTTARRTLPAGQAVETNTAQPAGTGDAMPVAFVGATSGNIGNTTVTSFNTAFHSNWSAGDVAILSTHYGGAALTTTTPTGWTLLPGVTWPVDQGTNSRCYAYYRVLEPGDTAPTLAYSGFITGGWTMQIFRHAHATNPIGQAGATTALASSVDTASLTGVLGGSALAVHVSGRVATGTIPTGFTPDADYTEAVDHATARSTASQNVRMEAAYRLVSGPGSYGGAGDAFTVTDGTSGSIIAVHVELLPGVAAATVVGVGQVTETDTAGTVTGRKTRPVGQVTEAETAQPATRRKTALSARVVETDTATAATEVHRRTAGQPAETDTAVPVARHKRRATGQPGEADTAQPVNRRKAAVIGQVVDTAVARPVAWPPTRLAGRTAETDTARPVTAGKRGTVGQASEADTATAAVERKTRAVGTVVETDTARPATAAKRVTAGQVPETDTARAVVGPLIRMIGRVTDTAIARPMGAVKSRPIGQAVDTSTARPVVEVKARTVGAAVETSTARPAAARKAKAIGAAVETASAQPASTAEHTLIGQVVEASTARPVTERKTRQVGQVTETSTARPVTRRHTKPVASVVDTSTATTISARKVRGVAAAVETDTARPTAVIRIRSVATATETGAALPVTARRWRTVGRADEFGAARPVAGIRVWQAGAATEVDTAAALTRGAGAGPARPGVLVVAGAVLQHAVTGAPLLHATRGDPTSATTTGDRRSPAVVGDRQRMGVT